MPDEDSDYAEAVAEQILSDGGIAPNLLWYEVRNVLILAERRGRISEQDAEQFLAVVSQLPLVLATTQPSDAVLALSRQYQLTVYDASYLEIALRTKQRLASEDKPLKAAAKKAGVELFVP